MTPFEYGKNCLLVINISSREIFIMLCLHTVNPPFPLLPADMLCNSVSSLKQFSKKYQK